MGKQLDQLTPELATFINEQPMFFVGTAPMAEDGRVNLSPKGLDSFRVLSPNRVAYLDLTGSGNETAAHLHENGRITVMFCSFGSHPNIVRLYGTGQTVLPGMAAWDELAAAFPDHPGIRQFILVDVAMVQTSCGFGVPKMDLVAQRDTLTRWADAKGADGLHAYRQQKNATSLDGLPAPLRDDVAISG